MFIAVAVLIQNQADYQQGVRIQGSGPRAWWWYPFFFSLRKIDIKLLPGSKIWGGCPIFTNLISFKLVQGSKFMGCIQIFPPLQFKKISVLSNFQLFFLKTFNLFHFSCLLYPYPPLGSTMHKNC